MMPMSRSLHELDGLFEHPVPAGSRRIAWNGISFCVPGNWELAIQKSMRKGATRIELEDEYSIRLESEWIQRRDDLELQRIMKRYEAASKPLTLKSEERHGIEGLPKGWYATHFVFKEMGTEEEGDDLALIRHDLVTMFYLCKETSIFCFVLLHVLPDDHEDPLALTRQLAGSFQHHTQTPFRPWLLFDIGFVMPQAFRLEQAGFDIGAKLMHFEWKQRRLLLWHFSCADQFLKEGVSAEKWATGYINSYSKLKGPVFSPGEAGKIEWRRRKPYLFGHRHEIARFCFKYAAGCKLIPANKFVVWVFHYRSESDLQKLPAFEG